MGDNVAIDLWSERIVEQITQEFSWASGFILIGLLALCIRRRSTMGLLLLGAVADVLFTLYINPMGIDDRQTGLFTLMTAAAAGAFGVSFIRQHVIARGVRAGAAWLTGLLVVGVASPAFIGAEFSRDLRHLYHAAQLGHESFDQALPRSLVLVSSDDLASSLTYLQGVENRRPDVTVIVKQHLSDPLSLRHAQQRSGTVHVSDGLVAKADAGALPTEMLEQIVDDNSSFPTLYELGDSRLDSRITDKIRLDLPLSRLYGAPTHNLTSRTYFYRMHWRAIAGARWPTIALYTLSRRYSGLGLRLWGAGDERFGFSLINEACALAPTEPVVRNNCGSIATLLDDHKRARKQFAAAISANPTYALGWFNLGVSQYHLGRRDESAESFATAARLGISADRLGRAFLYLSVLAANEGDSAEALGLLHVGRSSMHLAERRQADALRIQIEESLGAGDTDAATQSR